MEYAEYIPDIEGAYPGNALDLDSDAEEALSFHDEDRFWHQFRDVVAGLAGLKIHGEGYSELSPEDRHPLHSALLMRVDDVVASEGIAGLIDTEPIIKRTQNDG